MIEHDVQRPDWDRLFEIASSQQGLFTTQQAADAGYSSQLLVHYVKIRRARRVQRGIYRLVHFPAGDHEDLVRAWLWFQRAAVLSHQTALALHGLSDALPSRVHLTLPLAWERRRLRVPVGVDLHFADVPSEDRAWVSAVPTTGARRTLNDCALAALSPELLQRAARQALDRGLVTRGELGDVKRVLAPFGGIPR